MKKIQKEKSNDFKRFREILRAMKNCTEKIENFC